MIYKLCYLAATVNKAVVFACVCADFEDKRRENFSKGQAELERRRKALLDAQRRETEERQRR